MQNVIRVSQFILPSLVDITVVVLVVNFGRDVVSDIVVSVKVVIGGVSVYC